MTIEPRPARRSNILPLIAAVVLVAMAFRIGTVHERDYGCEEPKHQAVLGHINDMSKMGFCNLASMMLKEHACRITWRPAPHQ